MEKFQEMLHKLQLECEKVRKRPVHRNKQFEIVELDINKKQSKKDRLTIINAWFGNIPITRWYKDSLKYDGLEFERWTWGYMKVTSPFNFKRYKYKIEPLLEYPQFRYREDSKTYVGFYTHDSFIFLHNEGKPNFIGSCVTSSYANIYNPVWQECSLELIKELNEKESIRNTLRKAGFIMKIDIETETTKIYNEERANEIS